MLLNCGVWFTHTLIGYRFHVVLFYWFYILPFSSQVRYNSFSCSCCCCCVMQNVPVGKKVVFYFKYLIPRVQAIHGWGGYRHFCEFTPPPLTIYCQGGFLSFPARLLPFLGTFLLKKSHFSFHAWLLLFWVLFVKKSRDMASFLREPF